MNLSSMASSAQLNSDSAEGASARTEYQVAVSQKISTQIRQEGEAMVKLIESTPAPSDGVRGVNLNTRA